MDLTDCPSASSRAPTALLLPNAAPLTYCGAITLRRMPTVVKGTTLPPWRVATDLKGEEMVLNHVIVVCGPPDNLHLVADCRSTTLPLEEQMSNCRLVARAPALADALIEIERRVGDLRHNETTDIIYGIVARAMKGLDLKPRHDEDEHG